MRFLLENRTVGADEALALGMVGEVVDDDAFADRLAEYCALLAERSPITARLTKRDDRQGDDRDRRRGRTSASSCRASSRAFRSNDAQEARKAFFEKRTPTFEGR